MLIGLLIGWAAADVDARPAQFSHDRIQRGELGRDFFRSKPQKIVVIDPGHGGTNTGAPAAVIGILEKQVTLAYARGIRHRLRAKGVQVYLTRNSDRYLTLRQRTSFANKMKADVFISVHMNAAIKHDQKGYETYILTPRSLEIDAPALRMGARPRLGLDLATALILEDVERGVAFSRAARLARLVQNGLRTARGPRGDRGVKQDAMHVLLGATMPAVLVEVGFLDHPVEGPSLLGADVFGRVCDALAEAVLQSLQAF